MLESFASAVPAQPVASAAPAPPVADVMTGPSSPSSGRVSGPSGEASPNGAGNGSPNELPNGSANGPAKRVDGTAAIMAFLANPGGGLPLQAIAAELKRLSESLARVIRGKQDVLDQLMIAFLAGGSVLLEDVPGVGKTTLAKALARSLDLKFRRVQFTPDLLPTDILGASVYNPQDGSFTFREGPVFCSILLADEINRASPRTQSALLEAMSEGQATIEGRRYPLPAPFLVLATQNPVDFQGTYPLPEAQLDRFLMHLEMGYPEAAEEVQILYSQMVEEPIDAVESVLDSTSILAMQEAVKRVQVDESVARYIVEIVRRTREHAGVRLGVSPRGSLMFFRAAQASALADGRDFVLPDDVKRLAGPVLAHRLMLAGRARGTTEARETIVAEIVAATPVPV